MDGQPCSNNTTGLVAVFGDSKGESEVRLFEDSGARRSRGASCKIATNVRSDTVGSL